MENWSLLHQWSMTAHHTHVHITDSWQRVLPMYVEAGRVEAEKQVFMLSHYLMGKVHKFYIREVAGDPYSWGLQEFFLELFNSCCSVDFCTKQCHKLGECLQWGGTIREYIFKIYKLWNLIGDVSECKKWLSFGNPDWCGSGQMYRFNSITSDVMTNAST